MSEEFDNFLNKAKVAILKDILRSINEKTDGTKAMLKMRVQDAVRGYTKEDLQKLAKDFMPERNRNESESSDDHGSELEGEPPAEQSDDIDEELNNLREACKKKEEIILLRRKLKQLQIEDAAHENPSQRPHVSSSFKDMEDLMCPYSGDDNFPIDRWVEHFEEYSETLHLDDRTKFIFGKRLLIGTARIFIRSLKTRTWTELRNALMGEFKRIVTKADIFSELNARKRRRDETIQQYVLSMQEIASHNPIEEEDLIQFIIKGISDVEINKSILYNANNIEELKSALRKYEKFKNNSRERDNLTYKPSTTHNYRNKHRNIPLKKNVEREAVDAPVSNFYQKKEFTCFKCGTRGHIAKNCLKDKPVLTLKANSIEDYQQISNQQIHREAREIFNREKSRFQQRCSLETNNFEKQISYRFIESGFECSSVLTTLLDSGSPISFIKEKYLPPSLILPLDKNSQSYFGVNNSPLQVLGSVNTFIIFENLNTNLSLLVVENNSMSYPAVLGRNFIDKIGMVLTRCETKGEGDINVNLSESPNNVVECNRSSDVTLSSLNPYPETHVCMNLSSSSQCQCPHVSKLSEEVNFIKQIYNINLCDEESELDIRVNSDLPFSVQESVKNVVRPAFDTSLDCVVPDENEFKMSIVLSKDIPFHCPPRRLPYSHKIELEKILKDLLSKGIIRESNSQYASPIVLVEKKNKEFRLCIDYRELNKITLRDNYPLPLIEDNIDRLKNKKYYTTLDLKNGFYHVSLEEESRKYTSFTTPIGQYEFTKMPFGLKNAPSVFERYMKHLFGKLIQQSKVLTYLDDILIATETIEEHIDILKEVVNIVVTKGKFINQFANKAKPLYDLLRKDATFVFGPKEKAVFNLLKSKLISAPVLSIYSPNSPTELHCDASTHGFGAVLLQKQSDGKFHPVFYFSKRTTEAESRFHSYELETLSIVYALRRFRIYLLGIPFKIVTDCQALVLTLNKKTLNPRISRWALELQAYDYSVEHRKSDRMSHVDSLSRSFNILHIDDESFEFVLAAAQKQDPKIIAIASELIKSESPHYDMVDGLIYRKSKDNILFYVPSHMEEQVVRTHHEALCHLGVDKCFEHISRIYWFPHMKDKIRTVVKNCLKCIYFSPESGKAEGVLHPIPKGNIPFDTLHIDHLGPFSNSRSNKKHIFVMIDGFTKFTKLYPNKSTSSKEAIECLKSYFANFSRPNRIISDRGTCFTSKEFSEFLNDNNIQHVKVATHTPQSNGQVERLNRIITPMLAKECEAHTTIDWDKHLEKVEFAINNSVNRSTGFTPSTLLFGRDQKGKFCDKVKEFLVNNLGSDKINLDEIRKEAEEKNEKEQLKNKLYYDNRHKSPTEYKQGDYIMIKNIDTTPGTNKKLLAKFRGPYEIKKVLPNHRYAIGDIEGLQLTRLPYKGICSPSNMKLYVTPNIDLKGDELHECASKN
ncbi:uncharacterized protein LOC129945117 [Eupeodes corollae]|uniref:uncharacterized protein LOC129945117 n=1 Tax=Eupeodes corollae TaxID=290404 RepID=UPI002490B5EC|nr:uncharacterized protein LOC129945117 [Eupeodes corollae]